MNRIYVCPIHKRNIFPNPPGTQHLLFLGSKDNHHDTIMKFNDCLILFFNDITESINGLTIPKQEHIQAIIEFFGEWDEKFPMVICCQMGISRSTAAAIIGCATIRPNMDPLTITQILRERSPSATPNKKMIELADTILKRNGRLIDAVECIRQGEGPASPFYIYNEDLESDAL